MQLVPQTVRFKTDKHIFVNLFFKAHIKIALCLSQKVCTEIYKIGNKEILKNTTILNN